MKKENYYRLDIQGLRAIAVLSVIIFHINPDIFPNGFIGVDIFFVISGYLIADILLRKRHKGTKAIEIIKQFYVSRFNRIFPAYLFMLLGGSFVSAILFIPDDFSEFFKSLEKAFIFTSNQYFASFGDYFSIQITEQPLLHSWSLSVETQFYIIVPFLILFIPKRYLSILLIFFILLLSGWAEYYFYSREIKQSIYYGVQFRLPEFFIGILGALYVYEKRALPLEFCIIGLFILIFALVFQSSLGFFPGVRALIPSIGTVLILTSQHYKNPINKILTNKILVYVGNISYSLYLWHWPILVFMRYCGYEITSIFEILIFIIITLMLSLFSYYFIEKKIKLNFLLYGIILLVTPIFIYFGSMYVNKKLSPPEKSISYLRYADPNEICHSWVNNDCLKGSLQSKKEILVLGDSHAAMLNHYFDYLGKELDFKAKIITSSNCVTIKEFDVHRLVEWARENCRRQIDFVSDYIKPENSIIFISASWDYHLDSKEFRLALKSFIETNKKNFIYLMPETPTLTLHPLRSERLEYLGFQSNYDISKSYIERNHYLYALANEYDNVTYIKLNDEFFTKELLRKRNFIYYDTHHLNEIGAILYAISTKDNIENILNTKF